MKHPIRANNSLPHGMFDRRFVVELRLLHGYLEGLTGTLGEGLDPVAESRFLEAVHEAHCRAGMACAQLDLALAGGDELAALETCLDTSKACLKVARSCEPGHALGELGESMRLLGLCSVSLVCSALAEVEKRAASKAPRPARELRAPKAAMLAGV